MDQRQLEKERIRLTREIVMLEQQFTAATRGKEEKIEENKQIREEITKLEEENKVLEEETRKLDEQIAELDGEFKNAQIDAGRLRREIKVNIERSENEKKLKTELMAQIARLEKNLEALRRDIKVEIEDRRSLEARLRKTNAHIDTMKQHWAAGFFVTRQLEKQDWYIRQEEPDLSYEIGSTDGEAAKGEEPEIQPSAEQPEGMQEGPTETKEEEGEIDFTVR